LTLGEYVNFTQTQQDADKLRKSNDQMPIKKSQPINAIVKVKEARRIVSVIGPTTHLVT